jgi:hypothetical protein
VKGKVGAKFFSLIFGIVIMGGNSMEAAAQMVPTDCIFFEAPLALGTSFGGPPGSQSPGDLIFTDKNVQVRVDNFFLPSGATLFGAASVDNFSFVPLGAGQNMRTNAINLVFDFSLLGFQPSKVWLAFVDRGGIENIIFRGQRAVGDLSTAPTPIGGADLLVLTGPGPGSSQMGLVILTGTPITPVINRMAIGGLETHLDSVCWMK